MADNEIAERVRALMGEHLDADTVNEVVCAIALDPELRREVNRRAREEARG